MTTHEDHILCCFTCAGALSVSMRAHQVHPWDTRGPGEAIRSPVTGITDGCAVLCHITAAVWVLGLQACTATPTQLIGSISILLILLRRNLHPLVDVCVCLPSL